ncbi:uncharacterized protein LOC119190190 [Manduca sexta]|uniref:uncharacterized protein LOC119190190 n=1 Tax=Manduca sexta TaxID=7130 RepID=UPI0018907E79|nr:uncharacterized protein LOC119190190 [Manduca sexta]
MSIGRLSEFDVQTGQWSSYIDRLDMYFKVNKITDDLKLPTMIATMGDEAYELLVNLASPNKPSDLVYQVVVDMMRNHLQPTPSSLAERFRFRQKRQGAEEDIAAYVAELKKLARNCKFAANLNENLRDQFVCGLKSDVIRQRLFGEDDSVTFVEAVKLATSLEAAERDAAVVESAASTNETGSNKTSAVHTLMQSRRGGGGGRLRGRRRSAGMRPTFTTAGAATTYERGSRANCAACGATNHVYADCRFRDYRCSLCKHIGHLRRVCSWDDGKLSRGVVTDRRERQKEGFHYNDADRETSDEEEENIVENLNLMGLDSYKAI